MNASIKTIIALSTMLTTTLLLSADRFENSPRCAKKVDNIQKQIKIAKSHNNKHRVNGLEISLKKVEAHCSDDKLIENLKDKIADTKEDLKEHTKDYKESLKNNRSDKMKKYKSKIAEDKEKIKILEDELNN